MCKIKKNLILELLTLTSILPLINKPAITNKKGERFFSPY